MRHLCVRYLVILYISMVLRGPRKFTWQEQPRCLLSRMLVKMFITLCYVYMWVRFHKCYSVLIRNSLSRLNSSSSSFSFSVCPNSASAVATAPTTGRHTAARRQSSPLQPEDIVFLQLGDKAVYVTEPQVGYWI